MDIYTVEKGKQACSNWQCRSLSWWAPWAQVHSATFQTHRSSFRSYWKGLQNHTVISHISCRPVTGRLGEKFRVWRDHIKQRQRVRGKSARKLQKTDTLAPTTWHMAQHFSPVSWQSNLSIPLTWLNSTRKHSSMLAADDCSLRPPPSAAQSFQNIGYLETYCKFAYTLKFTKLHIGYVCFLFSSINVSCINLLDTSPFD